MLFIFMMMIFLEIYLSICISILVCCCCWKGAFAGSDTNLASYRLVRCCYWDLPEYIDVSIEKSREERKRGRRQHPSRILCRSTKEEAQEAQSSREEPHHKSPPFFPSSSFLWNRQHERSG